MAHCTGCGAELETGARFCPACGTPCAGTESAGSAPERPVKKKNRLPLLIAGLIALMLIAAACFFLVRRSGKAVYWIPGEETVERFLRFKGSDGEDLIRRSSAEISFDAGGTRLKAELVRDGSGGDPRDGSYTAEIRKDGSGYRVRVRADDAGEKAVIGIIREDRKDGRTILYSEGTTDVSEDLSAEAFAKEDFDPEWLEFDGEELDRAEGNGVPFMLLLDSRGRLEKGLYFGSSYDLTLMEYRYERPEDEKASAETETDYLIGGGSGALTAEPDVSFRTDSFSRKLDGGRIVSFEREGTGEAASSHGEDYLSVCSGSIRYDGKGFPEKEKIRREIYVGDQLGTSQERFVARKDLRKTDRKTAMEYRITRQILQGVFWRLGIYILTE